MEIARKNIGKAIHLPSKMSLFITPKTIAIAEPARTAHQTMGNPTENNIKAEISNCTANKSFHHFLEIISITITTGNKTAVKNPKDPTDPIVLNEKNNPNIWKIPIIWAINPEIQIIIIDVETFFFEKVLLTKK